MEGNSRIVILLCLFSCLSAVSCKSRKRVTDCSVVQINLAKNATELLEESQLNFDDLTLRIKANYKSGSTNQGFAMNLKMKKDSFVFVSIQVMIEAARAYITKDSFTVLDRIGKKYYQGAISDLSQFTGQELTLTQLQNVIVGNPMYAASLFALRNDELRNDFLQHNSNGLNNNIHLSGCYKLLESEFKSVQSTSSATIRYSNFAKIKDLGFMPQLLQFDGTSKGKDIQMTMEYTSVITDPITPFVFKVPSKYEKAN